MVIIYTFNGHGKVVHESNYVILCLLLYVQFMEQLNSKNIIFEKKTILFHTNLKIENVICFMQKNVLQQCFTRTLLSLQFGRNITTEEISISLQNSTTLIEKKLQKKHCVNTSLLTYYTLSTKIPFKKLNSITCSKNSPKSYTTFR